MWSAVRVSNKA